MPVLTDFHKYLEVWQNSMKWNNTKLRELAYLATDGKTGETFKLCFQAKQMNVFGLSQTYLFTA